MDTVASASGPAPSSAAGAPSDPSDSLIVALDVPSAAAALGLADQLQGLCRWFKVGMELYYAAGNSIVEQLRSRGFSVFLDLKLHDIPNTVASAVRSVASTGASLLTIHASGGEKMMRAAAEAATAPGSPRLLAVTVLTSMDSAELAATGICTDLTSSPTAGQTALAQSPAQIQVLRLARLTRAAGIHGLVCSSEEVTVLRSQLGPTPLLVVPGIRPTGTDAADQSRVATPADAIARGASMLVVGRPITRATDPQKAAAAILAEIAASR
jgi:orotidine-5'-phosphate decarboxylase